MKKLSRLFPALSAMLLLQQPAIGDDVQQAAAITDRNRVPIHGLATIATNMLQFVIQYLQLLPAPARKPRELTPV